jgi:hypothetical protein
MCIQKKQKGKEKERKENRRKQKNTDAILCHETEELERQRMKVT